MEKEKINCYECNRVISADENVKWSLVDGGHATCSDCVNNELQNRIIQLKEDEKVYLDLFKLQLIFYPIGLLMIAIFSSWFRFPSITTWLIISFAITTIPYHKYFLPYLDNMIDLISTPEEIKEVTITKHEDGTVTSNSNSIAFWSFLGVLIFSFLMIVLMLIFGALTPLVFPYFFYKYYKIHLDIKFWRKRMIYGYKEEGNEDNTYDFYITELPYQYHDALAQYLQKRNHVDEAKAYQTLRNLPALARSKVSIGDIYEDFLLLNKLITTVDGVKYTYSIKPHVQEAKK